MSNTINNANEVQVINNNGELVVSSRKVAEDFGKEHKVVLRSIREILVEQNCATKFFHETTHEYRGQQFPEYLMNRDGFSLVVFGFTGSKALEWKIKYINAFNAMEKKLKELSAPQTLDSLFNIDSLYLIVSKLKEEHDSLKSEIAAKDVTIAEQKITIKQLETQVKNTLLIPETLEVPTDNGKLYCVTAIANEFKGVNAVKLNKLLIEWEIQHKVGAHYELCEGFDESKYVSYSTYKGVITQMRWKEAGRSLIHKRLLQEGYQFA